MLKVRTLKNALLFPFFCLMAFALQAQPGNKKLPQFGTSPVKSVIAAMTTAEKIKLLVGMGMKLPGPTQGGAVGQTEDKVPGAAGTTFAIPRLGIPSLVVADGPAGLRISPVRDGDKSKTYYCTAFPVGSLLASTWDTALVKKAGMAIGSEVKEYGIDILLAPALNIQRNSLGGRNFEYYSEDPLVSGSIAAAYVKGVQANGVGTSVKHFAVNNQETNRMLINSILSERVLREMYLKGFEQVVKEAKPWTVMSSYNKVNGVYTSESKELLTGILRNEWGFKGFVMSDWFGGNDAAAQIKAGNELLMPGTPEQEKELTDAAAAGSLNEKVLDASVEHILNIILGSPSFSKYKFSNKPDLTAHAAIARSIAAEGMVLLKNEQQTLPLKGSVKTIAAFGNTSYDFISGGSGSGDVNEAYTISLIQGLAAAGYSLNEELKTFYETYITTAKEKRPKPKSFFEMVPPVAEPETTKDMIDKMAKLADIAIITIGRNSGEFQDRKKELDFYLNEVEKALIKNVSESFHAVGKKVVVLINTGGVVETASWRDNADALLLTWQPGQEAGNAVADLLTGKINPSGKLAVSFPVKYEDEPSAKYFPGIELSKEDVTGVFGMSKGKPSEVRHGEGMYVGYRYYTSFGVQPAYEFGYGLSYTHFAFSKLKLSSRVFKGKLKISTTITNIGNRPGKEVAQLYLGAPSKNLDKPAVELKAFAKTVLLQAGQSQVISFELGAKDLASYDEQKAAWVAEEGNYVLSVGSSSANKQQKAMFVLPGTMIAEKCSNKLVPQVTLNELQQKK
jgi:beta-glucosidase